jgi:hypothetical protein
VLPVHIGADDADANDFRELALRFGAVGPGGTPLVSRASGGGAAGTEALLDAIDAASRRVTYDVELVALDLPDDPPPPDPGEEVDASQFVTYVSAYRHSAAPGFSPEESVSHSAGDTFFAALRGVDVSYRVYYRNGTYRPGIDGRRLRARLVGRTTGGVELASWEIVFLVPGQVGDVDDGR